MCFVIIVVLVVAAYMAFCDSEPAKKIGITILSIFGLVFVGMMLHSEFTNPINGFTYVLAWISTISLILFATSCGVSLLLPDIKETRLRKKTAGIFVLVSAGISLVTLGLLFVLVFFSGGGSGSNHFIPPEFRRP